MFNNLTMAGWQKTVFVIAAAVLLLDQTSKLLIPAFGVSMIVNEGISFGWRPSSGWLTVVLLLFATVLIVTTYQHWRRAPIAAGLFLGGTLSNVLDRVFFGGVRDWLPIPLVGLYNNLADWAIAAAVLLLLIQFLKKSPSSRKVDS